MVKTVFRKTKGWKYILSKGATFAITDCRGDWLLRNKETVALKLWHHKSIISKDI